MMPRRIVASKVYRAAVFVLALVSAEIGHPALAQVTALPGSRNVTVRATLSPATLNVAEEALQIPGAVIVEQSEERGLAYVALTGSDPGVAVVDIRDPGVPTILTRWSYTPSGSGADISDLTYFRKGNGFYLVVGLHFDSSGDSSDDGAVVLNATDVRRSGRLAEVHRLRAPGGARSVFAYRHSSGDALLLAATGSILDLFDASELAAGRDRVVAQIELPEEVSNVAGGFRSATAAWHAETDTDRLYASGAGGYYVYDITDPGQPELLTAVSSAAVQTGHTMLPTPDGSQVVTTAGYRTAPVRIFDLRPALDGTVSRVRTAVGAWMADWRNSVDNVAVRWPFIFAAAHEDGFQVVNMMNPIEPYTDAYYYTRRADAPVDPSPYGGTGAWDIDVRNSDGLILMTDTTTGLWLFRVEGFEAWDGRGWGLPNVSTAQDWIDGPAASIKWSDSTGE